MGFAAFRRSEPVARLRGFSVRTSSFSLRASILTLIPLLIIFFTARIPAAIFIGIWFLMNFLSGVSSLGAENMGGVAWWAHVGGFLLGVLIAGFTKLVRRTAPPR